MSSIINLFKDGRKKALTLSYDDGITQDKRLVSIFNQYALKATFNINSGIQSEENYWINKGKKIQRMNIDEIEEVYKGHEVAAHSLTHPQLEDLPREMIINEIFEDRKNLEKIFGYPVRGMAYPYGTYNEKVIQVMENCGIEYSRTVNQHEKFYLPERFLEWHPTCHHKNPKLMEIAKHFIETDFRSMSLLYVWGHSYEFDIDENWELAEEFCKTVGNDESIWYATNIEIVDYLKALDSLRYSADCEIVYNTSAIPLWISVDKKIVEIKSGATIKIK
ncbi:polysaccharide deacetylase [Clostridium puniceum]|uniref:Polysaccharide deacetylase n=1 Tax=Clostridium puniceum TaxID=29367 RepID=A0A1S8TUV9_9CLOT|nr:polysaccharide deacetylase family protein [Clostridium puniceum]OOM81510.1 polysaccharide deacetylase [Clostridium puniceum]